MSEMPEENSQDEDKNITPENTQGNNSESQGSLKEGRESITQNSKLIYQKDSILLDSNATPLDILQKYKKVKQANDNRIKDMLKREGRYIEPEKKPPPLLEASDNELEVMEQVPSVQSIKKQWSINPSQLIMEPPYIIMNTVELTSQMSDEKPFRAIVTKNPSDWLLSILPDTGLISSQKEGGLLITCESKKMALPEKQSSQKGIIQICLEEEMKELEVYVNYIPVEIGKWVPTKIHPHRPPPKLPVHQQKKEGKKAQKMRSKNSDEPLEMLLMTAKSEENFETMEDDLRRKLNGITLNHIKATENLSDSFTIAKKVEHGKKLNTKNSEIKKKDNPSQFLINEIGVKNEIGTGLKSTVKHGTRKSIPLLEEVNSNFSGQSVSYTDTKMQKLLSTHQMIAERINRNVKRNGNEDENSRFKNIKGNIKTSISDAAENKSNSSLSQQQAVGLNVCSISTQKAMDVKLSSPNIQNKITENKNCDSICMIKKAPFKTSSSATKTDNTIDNNPATTQRKTRNKASMQTETRKTIQSLPSLTQKRNESDSHVSNFEEKNKNRLLPPIKKGMLITNNLYS